MEEENKIYIGNLDYDVKEEDIEKLMGEKGVEAKEVKIVKDRFTNKSKGFGFVEFEDNDSAQKAIELLDGQELKSRKIRVNRARRREDRFDKRGGGGGGGFKRY